MSCYTDMLQQIADSVLQQIIAANQASLDLMSGTVDSYTLDTGQSRQTVTKLDIEKLSKYINSLMNRYQQLCNQLHGGGSFVSRPGF